MGGIPNLRKDIFCLPKGKKVSQFEAVSLRYLNKFQFVFVHFPSPFGTEAFPYDPGQCLESIELMPKRKEEQLPTEWVKLTRV